MAFRLRKRAPGSDHDVVRRNALWNVLGIGLPAVVAVFFIPYLIRGMGTDRFGVLTLVLTFLNYFGLFDLGIGRALTQLLAGRADRDEREEAVLIWSVSAVLFALGSVAGVVFFFSVPFLVERLLKIEGPLAAETVPALRMLAFVLPFLLHSLALKGILEAKRRFDLSNMVRIPVVTFTFAAPLLMLPFTHDLRVLLPVMLAGRLLAWALNAGMVLRLLPHLRRERGWRPAEVGMLVRMGGWFTVTGVVAPLIDGMDRFFISGMLSISMVAFYTTPYDLITRLGIISGGIGGAIFPEFAMRFRQNVAEARSLFMRSVKYLMAILFPFALVATAFAHEGLALWLTPEFADLSAPVLRWLAIFVFLTGAALTPYLFLGGVGRPDLSVRVHLVELPVQAALLYVLIKAMGIRGAAIACVLRITIDFLGLLYYSGRLMRFNASTYVRILTPVAGAVGLLLAFHIPMPLAPRALLAAATLALYAATTWIVIIEPRDKETFRKFLKKTRLS